MGHWCRFFLKAVSETAENGKQTFQRILSLRQDLEHLIVSLGRRAENGRRLIYHLYEHPAVTVHQVMEVLNVQFNPAGNLIATLKDTRNELKNAFKTPIIYGATYRKKYLD